MNLLLNEFDKEASEVYRLNKTARDQLIRNILDQLLTIEAKDMDGSRLEAGQTYLGQLIAHDIVSSTSLHSNRKSISPALNLKCIYGDESRNAFFNISGEFVLGTSDNMSYGTDILRDSNGTALIPDLRNDENIIISQFHLLWQKLHNKILAAIRSQYPNRNDFFQLTRHIVLNLYHRVILDDFLFVVLDTNVRNYYFLNKGKLQFYNPRDELKIIPKEFSFAAFRFGHSMVKNRYRLNQNKSASLEKILSSSSKVLPSELLIDWAFFFQLKDLDKPYAECREEYFEKRIAKKNAQIKVINDAEKIDLKVAEPMARIPKIKNNCLTKLLEKLGLLNSFTLDIREINLQSMLSMSMATGQELRNFLASRSKFHKDNLPVIDNSTQVDYMPLWIYILRESEEYNSGATSKCSQLGPLGSVIVSEVIIKSMQKAKKELRLNKFKLFVEEFIQKNIQLEYSRLRMGHIVNYLERSNV